MLDIAREVKKSFSTLEAVSLKPRPRIWLINRFFWPDVSATSQMVSDLAFHLAESGYDVSVIASSGQYQDGSANLPTFERHRGVDIYRVKRPRFSRSGLVGRGYDYLSMYVRFAWALAKRARRGDVVVVKTDPPMLSCAIAPVATALGLRQINWLQDLYPEVAFGLGVKSLRPLGPLLFAVRDWSLKQSAANIAIGEGMAAKLRARGVKKDSITVIPNWCNDSTITPKPVSANVMRSAWGLDGKFVVGYSGNLGRAHECETVLAAAEQLRHRRDIVFLFIGGGRVAEELKVRVKERGLEHAFRFQPYQAAEVLPESLGVADVHWISLRPEMEGLIVPSKFYGVAAAGRATIAVTDLSGELAGIVTKYRCGLAVRPGDGDGMASAIVKLQKSDVLRTEMGRNARLLLDRRLKRSRAFMQWDNCLQLTINGAEDTVSVGLERSSAAVNHPAAG